MKPNKFFSSIIRKLRLIIVPLLTFLLGMVAVLCFVNGDKFSDGVSALANTIMALAAILGLVFARKWKHDATKDKVIDKCIEIMTVVMPDIKKTYVPSDNIKKTHAILTRFKENKLTNSKDAHEFRNSFRYYYDSMKRGVNILNLYRTDLKFIKTLSWKINKKLEDDLSNYKKILESIRNKEDQLLTFTVVLLTYWGLSPFDGEICKEFESSEYNFSNNDFVDDCLKLCDEIINLKEELSKLVQKIDFEEMSIFDVFEPS